MRAPRVALVVVLVLAFVVSFAARPATAQTFPTPLAVAYRTFVNPDPIEVLSFVVFVIGSAEDASTYYDELVRTSDIPSPESTGTRVSIERVRDESAGFAAEWPTNDPGGQDGGVVFVRDRNLIFMLTVATTAGDGRADLDRAATLAGDLFAEPRQPLLASAGSNPGETSLDEMTGVAMLDPMQLLPSFDELPPGFTLSGEGQGIPAPPDQQEDAEDRTPPAGTT